MAENPYTAPRAHVEDRPPAGPKTFRADPAWVTAKAASEKRIQELGEKIRRAVSVRRLP